MAIEYRCAEARHYNPRVRPRVRMDAAAAYGLAAQPDDHHRVVQPRDRGTTPAEVCAVPRRRQARDAADDLRGGASVGGGDQRAGAVAADATMAGRARL